MNNTPGNNDENITNDENNIIPAADKPNGKGVSKEELAQTEKELKDLFSSESTPTKKTTKSAPPRKVTKVSSSEQKPVSKAGAKPEVKKAPSKKQPTTVVKKAVPDTASSANNEEFELLDFDQTKEIPTTVSADKPLKEDAVPVADQSAFEPSIELNDTVKPDVEQQGDVIDFDDPFLSLEAMASDNIEEIQPTTFVEEVPPPKPQPKEEVIIPKETIEPEKVEEIILEEVSYSEIPPKEAEPVVKEKPPIVKEKPPVIKETPVVKEPPVVKETPVVKEPPVVKDAPVDDNFAIVIEAADEEVAPIIPVVKETPKPPTKKTNKPQPKKEEGTNVGDISVAVVEQPSVKKIQPSENREKLPSGFMLGTCEKVIASYRAFKTLDTNAQGYVTVTNKRLIIEETKTSEMPIRDVAGIKFSFGKWFRLGVFIISLVLAAAAACLIYFGTSMEQVWLKWLLIGLGAVAGIFFIILIFKWIKSNFAFTVYCREFEYFENYKSVKQKKDKSSVEGVIRAKQSSDTKKMINELGAIIVDIKDGLYD